MIRARKLAVGSHTAGATLVTIYTVPAGMRVRLREISLKVTAADTLAVSSVDVSGLFTKLIDTDPVYGAAGTQSFSLQRMLEAGDSVLVSAINVGNVVVWWLSGTTYDESS